MSSNPLAMNLEEWKEKSKKITFKTGIFIDGNFVSQSSANSFTTINPANKEVLTEVTKAGEEEVNLAVVSARKAWTSGCWRHMTPRSRMDVLIRLSDLIEKYQEELALLDSLDMGKPITDLLTIDIPEVILTFRYFAEAIDKIYGRISPTDSTHLHLVLREPLGVVGAISPWNYPLLMAVWKVAPALATGNSVVLKPSEIAPLSCLRLAELFIEAGGPLGVFNVINGGGETGRMLAQHQDVDKITFTGSTETGKKIMYYASESNMKKVALETGGKSPQIFMPDLENLDDAVQGALVGIYDNAGQVCNAGSRLLVQERLLDDFVDRFKTVSSRYFPGDPLDPKTTLGPLASSLQKKKVLNKIQFAEKSGAELIFGGDASDFNLGEYVKPTLFIGNNTMPIAREEIFGPVAVVIPFKNKEDAVKIANDTIYGLAASVWTSNLKLAHQMIQSLEAGVIWVNCFGDGDMNQPFGGFKQSGNSRDKSLDSLLSYTQIKSAWIKF